MWERNHRNNGPLNEGQLHRNTETECESILATLDSNPYQLLAELQPSALSPPPWLCMMDYHLWQSQRVCEREGGQSQQEHIHWSGSAGLRNYGVTEIWGELRRAKGPSGVRGANSCWTLRKPPSAQSHLEGFNSASNFDQHYYSPLVPLATCQQLEEC